MRQSTDYVVIYPEITPLSHKGCVYLQNHFYDLGITRV